MKDNKEIYGTIYIIENLVNKKVYVGQTTQTIKRRFGQHTKEAKYGIKKTSPILNALRKYGKENFSYKKIEYCFSKNHLDEREIFWISFHKSNSYNLRSGGSRGKHSEITKKKLSKIKKGTKCPKLSLLMQGRKLSKNHKKNISKGLNSFYKTPNGTKVKKQFSIQRIGNKNTAGRFLSELHKQKLSKSMSGEKNHFYGKKHNLKTKQKISDTHKGKIPWNKNKITKEILISKINAQTGVIIKYSSIKIASIENRIDQSAIYKVLNGKRKSAGGYFWEYRHVKESRKNRFMVDAPQFGWKKRCCAYDDDYNMDSVLYACNCRSSKRG